MPLFSIARKERSMAKTDAVSTIEPRCRAIADGMCLELVDLTIDREPGGKFLRFYIDKPEGVTLDDCETYHKAVMPLAEHLDYDYMEVSSPGIDRPLKKDRDFERHLGSEIEIRLFKAMDGSKEIRGILAGLVDGEIIVETGGTEKRIPRKAAALVKPVVSLEGIEEVDLSGGEELISAQESGENENEV